MTASRLTTLLAILAAASTCTANANESTTTTVAAPAPASGAQALPRVEIVSTAPDDDRRDANTSKLVVTAAELTRYGDTSLSAALQRVPGLTVTAGKGQIGSDIRIRGLGNGYTQLLINGETVPVGFSLDSLSPDLIQRVEVQRSGMADTSAQAIAGSVNIVLKQPRAAANTDTKLGASGYAGRKSGSATLQHGGTEGPLRYALGLGVTHDRKLWPSTVDLRASQAGTPLWARTTASTEQSDQYTLALTPNLRWKRDGGDDTLALDGLVQRQWLDYAGAEDRSTWYGSGPEFASNRMKAQQRVMQARLSATWTLVDSFGGRLAAKASGTSLERPSWNEVIGLDELTTPQQRRTVESLLTDRSASLNAKYSIVLTDTHSVSVGTEVERTSRSESRIQRETSDTGHATENLDEASTADVERLALFVQDEWATTPALSVYAGVRWEMLRTLAVGANFDPVANRSSVASPSMQLLWKIPDTKDQLRVALARTYRPPTPKELAPRRWVVNDNSATSPNFQGNPGLMPELAWGLDASFERYGPNSGFFGVNAYARQINGVILPRISQVDGAWVSVPYNHGTARTAGLEMEGKTKLARVFDGAADMSLRAAIGRNWSSVDQVPGPDNRLAQQTPFTARFGADLHPLGRPWTVGTSLSFDAGGAARQPAMQASRNGDKLLLDLYGSWKLPNGSLLRLAGANLLHRDTVEEQSYANAGFEQYQSTRSRNYTVWRITLETKWP